MCRDLYRMDLRNEMTDRLSFFYMPPWCRTVCTPTGADRLQFLPNSVQRVAFDDSAYGSVDLLVVDYPYAPVTIDEFSFLLKKIAPGGVLILSFPPSTWSRKSVEDICVSSGMHLLYFSRIYSLLRTAIFMFRLRHRRRYFPTSRLTRWIAKLELKLSPFVEFKKGEESLLVIRRNLPSDTPASLDERAKASICLTSNGYKLSDELTESLKRWRDFLMRSSLESTAEVILLASPQDDEMHSFPNTCEDFQNRFSQLEKHLSLILKPVPSKLIVHTLPNSRARSYETLIRFVRGKFIILDIHNRFPLQEFYTFIKPALNQINLQKAEAAHTGIFYGTHDKDRAYPGEVMLIHDFALRESRYRKLGGFFHSTGNDLSSVFYELKNEIKRYNYKVKEMLFSLREVFTKNHDEFKKRSPISFIYRSKGLRFLFWHIATVTAMVSLWILGAYILHLSESFSFYPVLAGVVAFAEILLTYALLHIEKFLLSRFVFYAPLRKITCILFALTFTPLFAWAFFTVKSVYPFRLWEEIERFFQFPFVMQTLMAGLGLIFSLVTFFIYKRFLVKDRRHEMFYERV